MKAVTARCDSHLSVTVDIHATTKKRLSTQALSTRVFRTRGIGKPGRGASWDYFVKLSPPELIFVTNIINYICGEKIVMWRNFGEIWGNFEKFWEILPQFTRFHVEKN